MPHCPPRTRSLPKLSSRTSRCNMPLSSGIIAVCGPTAGANDLIASSRSNALQLNNTTSNFSLSLSACTVGGLFSVASPLGLLITRPSRANSAARFSPFATRLLPFFPERADFKFKSPGAARLLVELPVGRRNRRRRHQQIGIIKRFLAPEFLPPFAHPRGVDAGIDDQMRDVNVLGSKLARYRLRHRA